MSRWWRAYDEAVDDPKLQMLPDRLFRAWFNICCIASQNDGVLPQINAVAFKLRCSLAKADEIMGELVDANLLDAIEADGKKKYTPHNWNGRQYKSDNKDSSNAERQSRYRERKRNGKSNGVTTVTITHPETEQKQNRTEARETRDDSDFEEWYRIYPRHEGKGHALKAYWNARKSTDPSTLLAGSEKAKKRWAGSDPKFIPLPATWLNGQRWLDEAPVKSMKIEGII